MGSLSYVVSKMSRHFVTGTIVSVVRIGHIAAQQRQRQAMAAEFVAGTSQLRFVSLYSECSEQLCSGVAG